jgi:hypothetical protein
MEPSDIEKLYTKYKDILKCPIECNWGWCTLIDKTLSKIQKHIKSLPPQEDCDIHFYISTVKEKYGTLRIYASIYDDEIDSIINDAAKKSSKICDQCGKKGKIRGSSWLYTACDDHTKPEDL